jgi:bifunctional pyridoxal-dependent enzyme with beta-cystathionase and maltose regulon repressor activities
LKRRFDIAADNVAGLSVNHFGLVACQAAYEHGEAWLNELREYLDGNLDMLRSFATAQEGVTLVEPEGTYLAWLDCGDWVWAATNCAISCAIALGCSSTKERCSATPARVSSA